MSLLEDLGAKGAPSRLLYDDEFEGPEAPSADPTSQAATQPKVDPTTIFPWTAASVTAALPSITTLMIAVDSLAATLTRAFAESLNTGKPAPKLGELRVSYPQPYAANRSSEPITSALPVHLVTTTAIASVSLDTLTTFPAELHTALITSLVSATKPKRILALTSGSLNTLPRTVRYDMDDDRARVLALRNHLFTLTSESSSKHIAPTMPAPMTLADLSAAALVQGTLASLPASVVALYLPHVRGAPEVTLAAMKEWSAAIQAELGAEVKINVDAVAKKAEALGAEQAAKFHPMYL
ncbi:hypothetical protein BCR44DRAFT_54012 [Catenaria anguillulae PL171]|uniref:Uncharacterized protein n=1 Tax=Catenaria anguillulae PL171 TaxID=765915 RepID=A0A1Y2HQ35_9FUNG|nr:hypothetical protein BCR44DRAFT_54012 [Catenaria anguillulae PL171]